MSMKTKIITTVFLIVIVGMAYWLIKQQASNTSTSSNVTPSPITKENSDQETIRAFMDNPNLEVKYVNKDLPTVYFRVGKITKVGSGENMDKVDSWVREVNVYDQKDLLNGSCSVYEYHTDARNHALTAVVIRGLRQEEIDNLKKDKMPCQPSSDNETITKAEAENIAFSYLKRAIPNFEKIKDQFAYSPQYNSHEWIWEDNNFKLPEGLSSRPYNYPIIRISVYGNRTIQYWNTTSLFNN